MKQKRTQRILTRSQYFACDKSYSISLRTSDCFSLGWPMRDDGDFFKSVHDSKPVTMVQIWYTYVFCQYLLPTNLIRNFFGTNFIYRLEAHHKRILRKVQGRQISLRLDHFGTSSEVLTECGLSTFWLYRYYTEIVYGCSFTLTTVWHLLIF